MKKYVFMILALFILTTNANAESPTDKGVYSLSGSISYSHINSDIDYNISTFTMNPELVYFVYPNIALGASILYSKSSMGDWDGEAYGVGPVARYYFSNKETIYPFASLEYLYIKSETTNGPFSTEQERNDLALGFGIDFFISKNVALEPIIKYIFREYGSDTPVMPDRDEEELLIGIGINVFIF